jgi:hypothetical protein
MRLNKFHILVAAMASSCSKSNYQDPERKLRAAIIVHNYNDQTSGIHTISITCPNRIKTNWKDRTSSSFTKEFKISGKVGSELCGCLAECIPIGYDDSLICKSDTIPPPPHQGSISIHTVYGNESGFLMLEDCINYFPEDSSIIKCINKAEGLVSK